MSVIVAVGNHWDYLVRLVFQSQGRCSSSLFLHKIGTLWNCLSPRLTGNCAPKFSSSYSEASVGKIVVAETRSRYDNGKLLFFRRNMLQVGGDRPPPLFNVISDKRVHMPLHCTCTLRILYLWRSSKSRCCSGPEKASLAAAVFQDTRTTTSTRFLLMSLTPALRQSKNFCLHAPGVCVVSLEFRTKFILSELLLWGQRVMWRQLKPCHCVFA